MTEYQFTYIDTIGTIGGLLIIISFIPQLIVIVKNKSAKDVSISTYVILLIGQILWIIYGILRNDLQVIVTNIITTFLTIFIIIFSLYFNYLHLNSLDFNSLDYLYARNNQ
jgi:MtN3 and saliva related transmembrane protein